MSSIKDKLSMKTGRKIKVCHLITKMVYGGASLETLNLIENLDSRAFDSTVICGNQSEDEGSLLGDVMAEGFEIIVIRELVREIDLVRDIITFLRLVRILKTNKYDIVHTHGSKAGVIGRWAAAFCRVPVILYTVHGWGIKAEAKSFRTVLRLIERISALFTHRILFLTKSDMEEALVYKIGKRTQHTLVGYGTDLGPFLNVDRRRVIEKRKEMDVENLRIVGTVGRVSQQKNPQGFIEIARRVLQRRKDVVFVFVGGGEMLKQMENLVAQLGLSKSIVFLGVRKDVPEILANFDIFILPSLWEGLPRSVIEAMAMAKPVVVSKIDGIEEFVTDGINGMVVPKDQISRFASNIDYLLDDVGLCKQMGIRAKAVARQYDYKKVTARIELLYKQLILHTF